MNYKVQIVQGRVRELYIHSLRVTSVEDFERGIRESIAEWMRKNPGQDILEEGCTLLIERA